MKDLKARKADRAKRYKLEAEQQSPEAKKDPAKQEAPKDEKK